MRWWSGAVGRARAVDPLAADVVLAAVLAALVLAQHSRPGPLAAGARPGDLLGVALLVPICGVLAARRLRPGAVLVAQLALMLVYVLLGYPQNELGLPLVVAVYTLGAWRGLRASAVPLALVVAFLLVAFVVDPAVPGAVDLVVTVVLMGAAWWIGASVRLRREQVVLVEERAALLDRAREDLARRAVAQERLRIARELHDVVAHSMSVVAVQAGMAEHVLATEPERAGAALSAISDSSRSALRELRRLLGVLRDDDEPAGSLEPALGLDDLPALAQRTGAAGVAVELTVAGDPGVVPAGVGLTAYRIVQEALTNTVRHAGAGARAAVSVTCGPAAVEVLVVDDGRGTPGPPGAGSGSGLIGMRERVDVFGGDLDARAVPGGGWRVAARLPLDAPGARSALPADPGERR